MTSVKIVPIDVAALDAWRERLDAARGEAIAGILGFATECYEFQRDCAAKQGGSVYSNSMKEWFAITHDDASRWATVGANAQKLVICKSQLPPSMQTLYHLCEVPDNVIAARVTERTTQREARALKREHATKPVKPKPIGYAVVLVNRFGGSTRKYNAIRDANKDVVRALPGFARFISDPAQMKIFGDAWLRRFPESVAVERPPLPEKDERKVRRAIDAEIAKVQKEVHEIVDRKVHEKIAAEREQMFERVKAADQRVADYDIAISKLGKFMTLDEYRLVLGCLHPDRAPEDRKARFGEAFGIMKRLDKYF